MKFDPTRNLQKIWPDVGDLIARLWSSQFLRFLAVGCLNTVFGYGAYLICLLMRIPYQGAAVVATVFGVLFNFFTTGTIVFRNASIGKIFGFVAAYVVALAVNLVLLTWLVEHGVSKVLAQAIALPVVVVVAFLLNKFVVFGKSR